MSDKQSRPEWRSKKGPEPGEDIAEAVRQNSREGRLDCAMALSIAKRFGVPPNVVGKACDLLGIRISNCQLGCF